MLPVLCWSLSGTLVCNDNALTLYQVFSVLLISVVATPLATYCHLLQRVPQPHTLCCLDGLFYYLKVPPSNLTASLLHIQGVTQCVLDCTPHIPMCSNTSTKDSKNPWVLVLPHRTYEGDVGCIVASRDLSRGFLHPEFTLGRQVSKTGLAKATSTLRSAHTVRT